MCKDEIRDLQDPAITADLLSAKYIELLEEPKKKKSPKKGR